MFPRIMAVLLCTVVSTALAQSPGQGAELSLRVAVAATLDNNPGLNSYPLREQVLQGQRENAELAPALNAGASVENAFGTGELSSMDGAEFMLSLSSTLELGGKREARVDTVSRRIDRLNAELAVTQLDLVADTTYRFIDVVAAQERLALQEQALDIALQTQSMLEPLVEAGQAPQLEQLRAEAALSRARSAQQRARAALDSARIRLSSLWGSQNPDFETAGSDFFNVGEPGSLTTLLLGLEHNPDIKVFASEERVEQARLQEARARQQADIQWTAGLRHLKQLEDTGLVFSASMPLGSRERARGAIRSGQARLLEVDVQREARLNDMRGQLVSLHRQLEQAVAEVAVLQDEVLPLLDEMLAQTREAYENGLYTYVELISAQEDYLEARHALIGSAANAHQLRTEIERLSGEPLGR